MHVVATAGHVDHGKSTLVRTLTGMEPDRLAQERSRGMTIDLGFAWTQLPAVAGGRTETLAFVDVPGHERFVTTMLAGIGPVPAVLLVVAADEGWMPQTAEHVDACLALGVRDGILVITRCDRLDPEPALDDVRAQLAGTPLAELPSVGVCAPEGLGMDALRGELAALAARLPAPDPAADVRFWVDRAFTVRGAGTVVTGTLGAGTIRVGDELELITAAGGRRRVGVRGLQSLGERVQVATGVARVAVNLRGLPREAVGRGDVLCSPGVWQATREIDVRLHGTRWEAPAAESLRAQLQLHVGSAAVGVRVRPLGADTARLRLTRPLPLRIGDRAVLRDPGRHAVAAGVSILDVAPPPLRRRGAAAHRTIELAGMGPVPDAVAELTRRGMARRADLVAMGVPDADLAALVAGGTPTAGGWLVDRGLAGSLVERLRAAVARHDTDDPLDPGLPLEAARRAAGLPEAGLVEALLKGVTAPGLQVRGPRVVRPESGSGAGSAAGSLPGPVQAAMDALRADLERDPFGAPQADRLAELGLGPRQQASLIRTGQLMRVTDGVLLLPDAGDRAVAVLAGLEPGFTLSAARQALNTSRRVAVPLLELLARTGRTERTPDGGHRLI